MRLLVVLVLLSACSAPAAKTAVVMPVEASASSPTPWVKARRSDGVALLEAPARVLVSPDASAVVAPPLRARVVRVLVVPGQRVARGAPVAQVVMPELVSAAGAWLAAGERLQAWASRRAQLESVRAQGLVRLADVVEADVQLAEARAAQRLAQATLRAAGANEREAEKVVADGGATTLRAPIAGVVIAVAGAIGETREPTAEPLVRLVGEAPPRLEARFAQGLVSGATYSFVTQSGARFELVLAGVAPDVDAQDGATRAWFRLSHSAVLPAGTAGRVEVHPGDAANAAVVPARGVRLDSGRAFVTVLREGKATSVGVEVLSSSGTDALVRTIDGATLVDDEVAAEAQLAPGEGA